MGRSTCRVSALLVEDFLFEYRGQAKITDARFDRASDCFVLNIEGPEVPDSDEVAVEITKTYKKIRFVPYKVEPSPHVAKLFEGKDGGG